MCKSLIKGYLVWLFLGFKNRLSWLYLYQYFCKLGKIFEQNWKQYHKLVSLVYINMHNLCDFCTFSILFKKSFTNRAGILHDKEHVFKKDFCLTIMIIHKVCIIYSFLHFFHLSKNSETNQADILHGLMSW